MKKYYFFTSTNVLSKKKEKWKKYYFFTSTNVLSKDPMKNYKKQK